MSADNSLADASTSVRASETPGIRRWRTPIAFAIVLVGSAVLDGWLTASSLVWFGWLAVGAAAGLVAGKARAIWVVPVATLLVFPIALAFDRIGRFIAWPMMLEMWVVLVVVGGMVTAAGFALGVIAAVRRLGWITGVGLIVGLVGLTVWVGASGYIGSNDMVLAPTVWERCDTPRSMFGWEYEAINYDIADDDRLAAAPGGLAKCKDQGTKAGTEVVAEDGIEIAGWYIPAGSGAGPTAPTFIIAPGWKSNKSDVLKYASFFHDRFNLVILDLRNQGRSGGDRTTWGVREKLDIQAMVDWLERTKHPAWIGATGNSMGAATVLAAAVEDPRIRALVLDSMHADVTNTFADGVANERYLPGLPAAWAILGLSSLRSGEDIPSANPLGTIGRMGDRPVLLIHGTDDFLDTVDHAAKPNQAAAAAAGVPVTIHYCEGGGHGGLVNTCPDEWQAWLDGFLATVSDLAPRDSPAGTRVVRVALSPDRIAIEPATVPAGPIAVLTASDGTELAMIAASPDGKVRRGLTDAEVDAVLQGDLQGTVVVAGFRSSPDGAVSELGVLSVGKYVLLPADLVADQPVAAVSIPAGAAAVLEAVP